MDNLSGNFPLIMAYIDPGTGIALAGALAGYALPFLVGFLASALALLTWPARAAWRWVKCRYYGVRRERRVILLGLDGMDPRVAERLMADGKLSNLAALKNAGNYYPLPTSTPPESPVAWASFLTSTNPGQHGVFDFLYPDFTNYLPHLSTGEVNRIGSWFIFKRLAIPLSRAEVSHRRQGPPFYQRLARQGVTITALRQPMDFPVSPGPGQVLASMGVTDIKGRQGDYRIICDAPVPTGWPESKIITLPSGTGNNEISLPGPTISAGKESTLTLTLTRTETEVEISIDKKNIKLSAKEWSPLVEVNFPLSWGAKVPALLNFHLISINPLRLYVSPLMPHPRWPVLPLANPRKFSRRLWQQHDTFHTLGMVEPTDPLKDGVLDASAFLASVKQIRLEREQMLVEQLQRQPHGLLSMVFDLPDRVQHMFWREMEDPSATGHNVIPQVYQRLDEFVGTIKNQLKEDDILIIFSDHGFAPYQRDFHLNRWLVNEGYLTLGTEMSCERFFKGINWEKSRAYGLGFCSLYLNRQGREQQGIVGENERQKLCNEIRAKLLALRDPKTGKNPVKSVALGNEVYQGTETASAPDLIVGCRRGYRISSLSAIGGIGTEVFSDNTSAWSGDHCIDPKEVPGVIFANVPIPKNLTIQSLSTWVSSLFFLSPTHRD